MSWNCCFLPPLAASDLYRGLGVTKIRPTKLKMRELDPRPTRNYRARVVLVCNANIHKGNRKE